MFTLRVKAPKFSTLLIVCMNVFRCAEVDAGCTHARMHGCMHLDVVAPRVHIPVLVQRHV